MPRRTRIDREQDLLAFKKRLAEFFSRRRLRARLRFDKVAPRRMIRICRRIRTVKRPSSVVAIALISSLKIGRMFKTSARSPIGVPETWLVCAAHRYALQPIFTGAPNLRLTDPFRVSRKVKNPAAVRNGSF